MEENSSDLDLAELVDFDADADEVLRRIDSVLAVAFDDLAGGHLPSLELACSPIAVVTNLSRNCIFQNVIWVGRPIQDFK